MTTALKGRAIREGTYLGTGPDIAAALVFPDVCKTVDSDNMA